MVEKNAEKVSGVAGKELMPEKIDSSAIFARASSLRGVARSIEEHLTRGVFILGKESDEGEFRRVEFPLAVQVANALWEKSWELNKLALKKRMEDLKKEVSAEPQSADYLKSKLGELKGLFLRDRIEDLKGKDPKMPVGKEAVAKLRKERDELEDREMPVAERVRIQSEIQMGGKIFDLEEFEKGARLLENYFEGDKCWTLQELTRYRKEFQTKEDPELDAAIEKALEFADVTNKRCFLRCTELSGILERVDEVDALVRRVFLAVAEAIRPPIERMLNGDLADEAEEVRGFLLAVEAFTKGIKEAASTRDSYKFIANLDPRALEIGFETNRPVLVPDSKHPREKMEVDYKTTMSLVWTLEEAFAMKKAAKEAEKRRRDAEVEAAKKAPEEKPS